MNRRAKSIVVFLVLIALSIGWWWTRQKAGQQTENRRSSEIGPTSPAASSKPLPSFPTAPATPPVYVDPSATPDPEAIQRALASGEKGQVALAIMQLANAQRIEFYGQIVDQNGQPVSGVKVEGSTLLVLGADNSGGNYYQATSDSEGRFSFLDAHGNGMGFRFEKPGYEYNYRQPPGWTSDYKPDPHNPIKITIWKLTGPEPMVHTQLNSRLPYDGQAGTFGAAFDFTTGKMSGRGELHITFTQNPLVVRRGIDHYDWSMRIEILGGGLVEATDPYRNLAPESGYQPAFVFAQAKNDPKWQDRLIKTFYLRTAQGQYGRVLVDVTPGTNRPDAGLGIGLSIETWLNPSGSRNLEFDEAKQVKP